MIGSGTRRGDVAEARSVHAEQRSDAMQAALTTENCAAHRAATSGAGHRSRNRHRAGQLRADLNEARLTQVAQNLAG